MLWLHRCRCFRFWDACNQKKKGDLIGFDMVLLDEKISIAGHRLKTFKNLFREGVLYELESRVRTGSNQSTPPYSNSPRFNCNLLSNLYEKGLICVQSRSP
ncbi:hypothetical protein YC2023_024417 [Brassica napus]